MGLDLLPRFLAETPDPAAESREGDLFLIVGFGLEAQVRCCLDCTRGGFPSSCRYSIRVAVLELQLISARDQAA